MVRMVCSYMTAVCISIVGIIGTFCASNAAPPPLAECWYIGPDSQYCYVEDATTLPLFLSRYDPTLGGINCDSDCSQIGDGTAVTDCFRCMACPPGMYWSWLEFAGQQWQCRDEGGSVVPKYRTTYTAAGFVTGWAIIVDLLTLGYVPEIAYELVEWEYVE